MQDKAKIGEHAAVYKVDRSGEPTEDPAGADDVYKVELDAACKNLHAVRSDLAQLLVHIQKKPVLRQQVSGLLKKAYSRLEELRERQADLSSPATEEPGLAELIGQANRALKTGKPFSLDDSDQALEKAYWRCVESDELPENAARIRAMQALIAAARQEYRRAVELYAQAAATPGLENPLQWRYQDKCASVLEDLGREFLDDSALEQAIDLYENTVLALAPRNERPDDWATTQNHLGSTLVVLGQRQRGTRLLEKAITVFEAALEERSQEGTPLDWAATRNNLGRALGTLAQRRADTEMLEKSIEVFESALEQRTLEETPQDWAITQNNLGAALLTLGQRKKDKTILKRASDAYKNVLQVWTRERAPQDWAMTMNNLGTALRALGEHRKGPRTLEQSVAAYRSALSERTRERVPQEWAMTQNNLGAALHKLGERKEEVSHLAASIEAYENALKEWTQESEPLTWAMTLANQAAARKALAELTSDVELVRRALSDFRAIGDVFRAASHAQYYELVVEQVALLRKLEKQILEAEEA
jgi:tetratricopeptide (TPR) repeat protein